MSAWPAPNLNTTQQFPQETKGHTMSEYTIDFIEIFEDLDTVAKARDFTAEFNDLLSQYGVERHAIELPNPTIKINIMVETSTEVVVEVAAEDLPNTSEGALDKAALLELGVDSWEDYTREAFPDSVDSYIDDYTVEWL